MSPTRRPQSSCVPTTIQCRSGSMIWSTPKVFNPWTGVNPVWGTTPDICAELFQGAYTRYSPGMKIQAGGYAQVDSVDTHPNGPNVTLSCNGASGTSAVSLWIKLLGGTS